MKRLLAASIILGIFGAAFFLSAEDSAFSAGDATSPTAYGLSANEKALKDKLDSLTNSLSTLNAKTSEQDQAQNQAIEGLRSTLEGINAQYARSTSRLTALELAENNISRAIDELRIYAEQSRAIQEANNKQIKKVLTELSSLIDSLSSEGLSQDIASIDSNSTLAEANATGPSVGVGGAAAALGARVAAAGETNSTEAAATGAGARSAASSAAGGVAAAAAGTAGVATAMGGVAEANSTTAKTTAKDEGWKKLKGDEILKLANEDSRAGRDEDGREKLNFLISHKHKPAQATYLLGEIEYKNKNYSAALGFYKASSALSTTGDYFPRLLYHTAISLDKLGDTNAANGFYRALKASYPQSPEAKASPNRKN